MPVLNCVTESQTSRKMSIGRSVFPLSGSLHCIVTYHCKLSGTVVCQPYMENDRDSNTTPRVLSTLGLLTGTWTQAYE